jgi:hypothetical protein
MSNHTRVWKLLIVSLVYVSCTTQAGAGQWIIGSVSIRNDSDQNVYGERLAVFLVSRESKASVDECLGETHFQRRLDCINNSHLDFYKQFQRHQQKAGYLMDQTETSNTGNFIFFNVPVGSYFLLVKFPSMIDGYKVAWQVPVTVVSGKPCFVSLNDGNLLLPKNRRR